MPTKRTIKTNQPCCFKQQLDQELEAIKKARQAVGWSLNSGKHRAEKTQSGENTESCSEDRQDPFAQAHDVNLLGLAFSGGGIRSATFNLGVIQKLAQIGLLSRIDYLSTVSGGGYIGSWLSAWVYRAQRDKNSSDIPGILSVEKELRKGLSGLKEPHEVDWLRRFSNYLTPRMGVLSSDTLTGVATYLRNLFLNQMILIAFGAAAITLPWLLSAFTQEVKETWVYFGLALTTSFLLVGAVLAGYETRHANMGCNLDIAAEAFDRQVWWRCRILVFCFAITALLAGILISHNADDIPWQWAFLSIAYGVGFSVGWCSAVFRIKKRIGQSSHFRLWYLQPLWALLSSSCLGGILFLWRRLVCSQDAILANPLTAVALGPAVVLGGLLFTITLHLGLSGRDLHEAGREFWSHHGGQQLRLCIAWLVLTGAALFGPWLLILMKDWIAALGGATWILTTLAGVLTGSGRMTAGPDSNKTAEIVARIAPYVFVAGFLLSLSYGVYRAGWAFWAGSNMKPREIICCNIPEEERDPLYDVTARLENDKTTESSIKSFNGKVYAAKTRPECTVERYLVEGQGLTKGHAGELFLLMLMLLSGSFGLSRRVDINVFSFHMFYRNRIERCYMGASNTNGRKPHPATGLDPGDAPKLKDLVLSDDSNSVQRPFPIVNTALNITSASNLAWQERKAASFTFTPIFCGYELDNIGEAKKQVPPCYQPTGEHLKQENKTISLGLPITISGAAASPNAGYHTNAATAFLMTVFNVRLGWWLQNPRLTAQWKHPGPKLALLMLIEELMGMATDKSKYIYLSDGGHFENLGIYELVRRRCRYVIACDAGCDPDYKFEDLGNAIRKCQIDFGIDIDIDPRAIYPEPESGRSTFHCAVGRINYQDGPPGFLLYIKASLTGDEPMDIVQYAAQHPDFPHQTTTDQWYSESQFESYRHLGLHTLGEALKDSTDLRGTGQDGAFVDLEEVFISLSERWYRPSPSVKKSFAKHGKALADIFELIRKDEHLHFLDAQIYPEWPYLMEALGEERLKSTSMVFPDKPEAFRAGFYLCNSLIQLMESVYLDLNLEGEYNHPDNRGWINLFRHWSWAGMLRVTWAVSASTYGARFQRFCQRRLDLELGRVTCHKIVAIEDPEKEISGLNFLENHIRSMVELCIEKPKDRMNIMQLSLEGGATFGESESSKFSFPFAFALVKIGSPRNELVYYRVRDHLRGMGLGRMGLAVLFEEQNIFYSRQTLSLAQQECVRGHIPEADYVSLGRLWDSVVKAAEERRSRQLDPIV
jgi:hypothetical protein